MKLIFLIVLRMFFRIFNNMKNSIIIHFYLIIIITIFLILFSSCASQKELANLKNEIAQLDEAINNILLDSDGDGIPDYLDLEPGTQPGAKVDNFGRTLDSDGDGTPDHLDKCPFVPGPASNDGCPVEYEMIERTLRDPNRSDQFWPIPPLSYVEDVSDSFIGNDETLEVLYSKIRRHLQKKGRSFNRVMYVPEDGFVIFSKLERINDLGTKLDLPIEIERGGCGILNIFHCLYGKPSGRYVFFGFVVNDGIGLNTNNDVQEYNEIMKYINRGYINLDNSYVRDIYSNPIPANGYKVSLIAYEYETYPGQVPKLVTNSRIPYFKLLFN